MNTSAGLKNAIKQIDHKGYPAYKQLKGSYQFEGYVLSIDHVQSDPFASPSKVSVRVEGKQAGFPEKLYALECQKTALEDVILREMGKQLRGASFKAKGSGKSGLMAVSQPGQEVLKRSSCQIEEAAGNLVLRMELGFPANGRTVNGRELEKMLFEYLPACVKKSLYYSAYDGRLLQKTADLAEDQQAVREKLEEMGLVAFVANGSVLPRESGVSSKPMKEAVLFQSPPSMEIEISVPNAGRIKGMGIKKGVTLIVGGGYHGKSTLLKALELGVYNHISGDGREYVITGSHAMKLRAEDGRSVKSVDISLFINNLPNGKDTRHFSTEDASGSTSQAANVIEAMEMGSKIFLIDEDTSATNFMIRDELMQRVVHREVEPITPYIERVRELYEKQGISTILVAGSCGSYFHKADAILQMNRYKPVDITEFAKEEAKAFPVLEGGEEGKAIDYHRVFSPNKKLLANDRIKTKTMGRDGISLDKETIDLRYVEQLADSEQLNMLAQIMKYMELHILDGKKTLTEAVDELELHLKNNGFAAVCGSSIPAGLAMPRRMEIFACLNRYRKL